MRLHDQFTSDNYEILIGAYVARFYQLADDGRGSETVIACRCPGRGVGRKMPVPGLDGSASKRINFGLFIFMSTTLLRLISSRYARFYCAFEPSISGRGFTIAPIRRYEISNAGEESARAAMKNSWFFIGRIADSATVCFWFCNAILRRLRRR